MPMLFHKAHDDDARYARVQVGGNNGKTCDLLMRVFIAEAEMQLQEITDIASENQNKELRTAEKQKQ